MRYTRSAVTALALVPLALAQTSTDCNPTEKTCPEDTGLEKSSFSTDFTQGKSSFSSWSAATGTTISYGDKGAEFTISKAGQAPTISTDFYIFFGTIEVKMQAAPGTGIVSSIVLESDDLDEIDWEFLGGDTTQVETNYFGKGNTTTYNRAIYYPVTSPQTSMHTYTVDWTSSQLQFSIDGSVVRTLLYDDAVDGKNYPQTPMRLKLGNWAGGASGEPAGTVEWAGGSTDFSDGPFTMYVESVKIESSNPAAKYEWTDKTGDWQSIKVISGDGDASRASSESASSDSSSSTQTHSQTTSAPTSSVLVNAVIQSQAAVSSTSTGSSATTTVAADTATARGYGSNTTTVAYAYNTTTVASAGLSTATSAGSNYTSRSNYTTTSTASPVQQTTSGAVVGKAVTALFGVLTIGVCCWVF